MTRLAEHMRRTCRVSSTVGPYGLPRKCIHELLIWQETVTYSQLEKLGKSPLAAGLKRMCSTRFLQWSSWSVPVRGPNVALISRDAPRMRRHCWKSAPFRRRRTAPFDRHRHDASGLRRCCKPVQIDATPSSVSTVLVRHARSQPCPFLSSKKLPTGAEPAGVGESC